MWIGAVSLLAFIHNPANVGRWIYTGLFLVGSTLGISIAGRHVWLQNLPPDQVPDCGMGLNYMLETMPFTEVLSEVLYGSGECAEIDWSFLGLSMPYWTLLWFIGLTVVTIVVVARASKAKA
jgi:disulfide bond formation protein DsbB